MRVTGRGYGVLAAGVVLLAAGFGFGYPELAALGCAAVVAVAGALAFVAWRPRLAIVRTADPDRVQRGHSIDVTLSITNASRLIGATLVARDRVTPGGSGPGAGSVAVPLLRLRPGRTTSVRYPVPARRRGLLHLGPLEISRRDPLGLVAVVWRYGEATTAWVRPRVHPIVAVPVGLSRSMDGRVDHAPQGTITFSALREYVVGDDLRHVHWRTSARVGSLIVREHVDTSLPRVVVLLDDRASAHAPGAGDESTFEAACEAAASVLVAAARASVRVELRLLSGATASGHREDEVDALLDLLAEADLHPAGPSLHPAVENLRVRRVGDTLVYLGGPADDDDLSLVAGLRGAYPSIIAGAFGPVGAARAADSGLLVVSCVDGAEFAAAWDGIRAW